MSGGALEVATFETVFIFLSSCYVMALSTLAGGTILRNMTAIAWQRHRLQPVKTIVSESF